MAYALVTGCYCCGSIFTCNPDKVPSLNVKGVREPVCLPCIERANPIRVAHGLQPIVPLPGAYEAQPEPTDTDWTGEE